MDLKIILIFFALVAGCNAQNNSNAVDSNSLISKHKADLLFLSFWPAMSESDFKTIVKLETKNGNLTDEKFNLLVPRYSTEYDEIPFSIVSTESSIVLEYKHDFWINWKDVGRNDYLDIERLAGKKANEYLNIQDYLIKTFDNKYQRVSTANYIWTFEQPNEKKKVIHLDFSYWHFVFDEQYNYRVYGKTAYIYVDEKKKRYKAAEAKINIRYEFYDTYIERQIKNEENARQYQIQKEKEKSQFDKKIDKNKNNL